MLQLRRYDRISVQNRRFRCNGGPVDRKFQVEGVAPTNYSSFLKTKLNDLSYGIKIWTDLSYVLSQFTHLTDRELSQCWHSIIGYWLLPHCRNLFQCLTWTILNRINRKTWWYNHRGWRRYIKTAQCSKEIKSNTHHYTQSWNKKLIRRQRTWTFFTTTSFTHYKIQ